MEWRDEYILTAAIRIPGERAAFYRAAGRGSYVRVLRGAYLPADRWDGLDFEGRHRARMRAAVLLEPGLVFSHLSAALVHGLPVIGGDLRLPHVVAEPDSGGRSRNGLARHCVGIPDRVVEIDGLPVTPIDVTAAHVVTGFEPELAVPVVDQLLRDRLVEKEEIARLVEGRPGTRGTARARWSLDFADGRSGSPGESLSRVGIRRLRLPAPDLQVPVRDGLGLAGIVDFAWPDHRLVGEFDGVGKYLRDSVTGGREPGDIVVDEKRREDRIRATGLRVVRWGWDAARSSSSLRLVLSDAGLRAR